MEKYGVYKNDAYEETLSGYDAVQMVNFTNGLNRIMVESVKSMDPQKAVSSFLEGLGKLFEAERAYIFEINGRGNYSASAEYVQPDFPSYKDKLQDLSEERLGHEWFDAFRADHGFMVTDMKTYAKQAPEMYEKFVKYQVKRIVACPLIYGGSLHGFITMNNVPDKFLRAGTAMLQIATNYLSAYFRSMRTVAFTGEGRHIDQVTGLYSPTIFRRTFQAFMDAHQRGEKEGQWAVIYFNTFQFSSFNSSHGYEEGDRFLRELGQCIRRAIRSDNLTRTEADRFYALVEAERAETVVQGVHEEIQHHGNLSADVYAGIYIIDEDLREASRAMDRAKLAADAVNVDHVHYYRYFRPEMEENLNLQSYLVSHVDEAIDRGFVQVYYQPVVSTLSHRINGFEALSRWIDPVYGFLNPASFIDTLEDARLLYKIDLYVIECVCQDIVNAQDRGVPLSGISVNLSRHDLELPGLHEKINQILFKYRVPHDALHMEITETALLDSESIVQDHIKRFHDDGYQVWLDDFGSGYSSLNTLQNFDFDVVKIDLMFLRHETPRTHAIMASIVDMTKRIGMVALTEGVETKEQFEFLEKIGCNFAQGYYFSKPQPLAELPKNEFLQSLGLVLPDERVFFWSMAHLNFLNPMGVFDDTDGEEFEKIPFAVLEINGQHFRALHANASIVDYAKKFMGIENPLEGTFTRNPGERAFQGLLRHAEETGETAYYDFVTSDGVARLQVRFISRYRERTAFLIAVTNIRSFLQRAMETRKDIKNIITNMYDSIRESGDKPFGFFPEDESKLQNSGESLGKAVREIAQTVAEEAAERSDALISTVKEARQKVETDKNICKNITDAMSSGAARTPSAGSVWKDSKLETAFFGMESFMDGKDAFLQRMHDENKRCGVISLQILGQKEFARAYDEKERELLLSTVEDAIRRSCDEETLIGSVAPGDVSILTVCRDRTELRYLEEQLTKVLTSIHKLPDGVPVTLYFLIGGMLHKESRELTETIALSKADMKSQEEVRLAALDMVHKNVVYATSALRHAIEDKTLKVLYRPRIGGISNQIVSFGAAVRWFDEDGNVMLAREYYEDVIRAGLSDDVERYVTEEICRDIHKWQEAGKRVLPVNIHFALKSFEDPGYFNTIRDIFEKYHIDPYFITIEFSLKELTENPILAEQVVMGFRNYGHRVRVNEFSGDFRSITMFGRFPFDFVRLTVQNNPLSDEKSRIVMREMVNMLKKLGVYVVVDRIATKDQADFLRAIGCNSMSGDYFGKQMPASEIDQYLKETGYTMATQAELDMLRKLGAVNPMDLNTTERVFNSKILEEHTVSYITRLRANASNRVIGAEAGRVVSSEGESGEASVSAGNLPRDRFETIFTNETGIENMKKFGFQSLKEMNDYSNSPAFTGYQQMIDCMNRCKKIGDVAEADFRSEHLHAGLRMELVYELDGKQYFLSLMRNPVKVK